MAENVEKTENRKQRTEFRRQESGDRMKRLRPQRTLRGKTVGETEVRRQKS